MADVLIDDRMKLKEALRQQIEALGFDTWGVAAADPLPGADYLSRWIEEGQAGDMVSWLGRNPESRAHPQDLLPGARSVIVVGLNYHQPEPERRGRIASYALGEDYHDILSTKLKHLATWLEDKGGRQRVAVDSSPLMEKPAAVRAGLGWMAKSTMLLNRHWGTWLFLGEVMTTLEFEPDLEESDHCGKCTACIDICPTRAITAPYQLDARRCISYLTIEHKGAIPEEFREAIGDHLFGCEECLTICPWNRWARPTREPRLAAMTRPDLRDMLSWDDIRFRKEFRGTPVYRLKRDRWLRNICVVLGNIGTGDDLPSLRQASGDDSELVREHAQWAIGRINRR